MLQHNPGLRRSILAYSWWDRGAAVQPRDLRLERLSHALLFSNFERKSPTSRALT